MAYLPYLRILYFVTALAIASLHPSSLAGQQDAGSEPAGRAQQVPAKSEARQVRIGAGDLLEITVFGVPELQQQARVSEAGEISMPLVGAVSLAGLTVKEAQAQLERRLVEGDFLKNPSVSILVKEYSTQGITVLGEVAKPGIYTLLGARRLFDAISAAGGTTPKSGRIVTVTRRDQPQEPLMVNLQGDPARNMASNVEVYPGDTVVVSKAGIVYVVGDVVRPGGFTMENNDSLSVLQALALAQGPNKTANLNQAKLIRKGSNGLEEVPIALDHVLKAQQTDLPMQAEDILFVPVSRGKTAARRTLEAIVQIATGAAVYSTVR